MNSRKITAPLSVLAFAVPLAASAANYALPPSQAMSNGLPQLNCTATKCSLDYSAPKFSTMQRAPKAQAANPNPVDAGPPPGQRLSWLGAGMPDNVCQSLGTGPVPTGTPYSNPYVYINAQDIPVPLGSTHASLLSTFSVNLSGGPAGAIGTVGFLQIKRSDNTQWMNVDTQYAYSIRGFPDPQSLWGKATYQGLSNLATLPGGNSVPDAIDVRMEMFNVFTNDGGFTNVNWNAVCYGRLDLTF